MDELQKAYKEIGRLEFEKEYLLKSIIELNALAQESENENKALYNSFIVGFTHSILTAFKKEE